MYTLLDACADGRIVPRTRFVRVVSLRRSRLGWSRRDHGRVPEEYGQGHPNRYRQREQGYNPRDSSRTCRIL